MKQHDLDRILDNALDEIRETEPDPTREREIAAHVWQHVSREVEQLSTPDESPQTIRDCSDYQALIPAYLRGALNEAKTMLVQDHLGECVPCRRALKEARATRRGAARSTTDSRKSSAVATWGWRVAAAAAILVALIGLDFKTEIFSIETGGVIHIQSLEGEVFQVTDEGTVPLRQGDAVDFSDVTGIRTGKDAHAMFVMADNSVIEMDERAELAVKNSRKFWQRGRGDGVIDLARGNIIVEAADQFDDELRVRTADANVNVTGTVFAVNHGMKGSRVSVIEGEVVMAYAGNRDVLHPGQQSTSRSSLGRTSVEDEIAWSRRLDEHLRLMTEFTRVTQEIEDVLQGPGLRYSTALLDMAPDDTIVYIGIPNFSSTLDQAYGMLQDKIEANELLRGWWLENVAGTDAEDHIEYAMEFIRGAGEQLGDEIAVTIQMNESRDVEEPLVFAHLARPAAFPAFVAGELDRLQSHSGERPDVRVITGKLAEGITGEPGDLYLWVQGDLLTLAASPERLQQFAAAASPSAFASSEFHGRLSALYKDGVEWVVGVNVAPLMASNEFNEERALFEDLGLTDLEHVIAERTSSADGPNENRIELGFNQPRRGLASWLAEPAPMGSLEFVSPDASLAAGFVMKEPKVALDELFRILGAHNDEFTHYVEQFEAEYGIDLREGIAAALGGEFAVALDGPALPVPAWKVVIEIYDATQLQMAMAWAVDRINSMASGTDFQGFALEQEEHGGRMYHRLRSIDADMSAHYTIVDGYLVASSSRALLDQAIQRRAAGVHLLSSPKFTTLLPVDSQINASAVVYQHMGGLLGGLTEQLRGFASRMSDENRAMIQELTDQTRPTLTLAYGEEERITIVHNDRGGFLGSGLSMLLRLDTLLSVQQLLREAESETQHHPQQEAPAVDETQVDPALTRG